MARLKDSSDKPLKELTTKIGSIQITAKDIVYFPYKILGFNNSSRYCILDFPGKEKDDFKLLQSVDDEKTCFVVLYITEKFYKDEGSIIKFSDIESAAESYNIDMDYLNIYLISSMKNDDQGQPTLSVNLKAPILIDRNTNVAYQHVFVKNEYPVSFLLK